MWKKIIETKQTPYSIEICSIKLETFDQFLGSKNQGKFEKSVANLAAVYDLIDSWEQSWHHKESLKEWRKLQKEINLISETYIHRIIFEGKIYNEEELIKFKNNEYQTDNLYVEEEALIRGLLSICKTDTDFEDFGFTDWHNLKMLEESLVKTEFDPLAQKYLKYLCNGRFLDNGDKRGVDYYTYLSHEEIKYLLIKLNELQFGLPSRMSYSYDPLFNDFSFMGDFTTVQS